jgi:hypothetical protein
MIGWVTAGHFLSGLQNLIVPIVAHGFKTQIDVPLIGKYAGELR